MLHPYKIYDASAGSGKTYVLTKAYLTLILSSNQPKNYRHILAITFTNKAVNEMKERILGSLFSFSRVADLDTAPSLFLDLLQELQINPETLRQRSKYVLKEILHNYSFFDVSTIDKFTHRLIRTFARDLQLAQNFEVVLDTDTLLFEAVNNLLNKAGTDEQLTKVLIDFALEKIDDDKSWDVTFDLNKIGKLLFHENHGKHLEKLKDKTISDFSDLKRQIRDKISALENLFRSTAATALQLIEQNGIEFTDFTGSFFPKFMQKIAEGDFNIDFKAVWKQQFDTKVLYNKSCPEETKTMLDNLHGKFIVHFNMLKENHSQLLFLKNAYSNIVPLSVLNAIQHEVKLLERERDILPISSFNSIISNEIKDQPVPFIFERLGEKYRHYFIDEFQDTSEMQWENLIPLIGNALDSEDPYGHLGSLLLVGDAKQAIYRWRGGRAEQFLNLVNRQTHPFVLSPLVDLLPTNYRSHEEIIKFNNAFFTETSPFLNSELYRQLFVNGNRQKLNTLKGGLVQITFIEEASEKNEDELYFDSVLSTIGEVCAQQYTYKDICVLTRTKKQGILLAESLMRHTIPIISSETLLLNSSPKVKFLLHLLQYSLTPGNKEIAYDILYFLLPETHEKHAIIKQYLGDLHLFLQREYHFNFGFLKKSSVYDGLEYAIKQFHLADGSDAYLIFLMDEVLDVEQREGSGTGAFLEHWEKQKEKLSITAPENVDAIQLMTIHKAKGLEFPVVIFPYANTPIYEEMDAKLWLPIEKGVLGDFQEILVNKKQEVADYGENAKVLYEQEQHKLELDAFNLLYVALTRAVNALYIISKKDLTAKGEHKTEFYSGLFIHFLKSSGLWESTQSKYTFGALAPPIHKAESKNKQERIVYPLTHKDRPDFKILAKAGMLWETDREQALTRGNLIHFILGLLNNPGDLDFIFETLIRNGELSPDETEELKQQVFQVIHHPNLKIYFEEGNNIKNEKEIITENGLILRPDRVILNGKRATIIDYKTGKKNVLYHAQLEAYAQALEQMNYAVENKIIVYINENVIPEFI